ncbi:TyrR/PhhR family helix-turn-helix DNA-binding protein [Microbulbifer aggregans]|uniref:TyrR/PhhR family helix-turn-helix DNA-binding protein n=1 Tax=Microbulbifer aggregans TaxID=1769779 RepID=UPI001CFEDBDA|nr:TyrR/PhhR family helix-turn-helix DNA-binding protein [Microbulbifer aggregans]
MAIFAEYRVNVTSGELGGDSGDKVFLVAPGLLIGQFQGIEKALYRVPGVDRVRRIELIPSERRQFELNTLLAHIADPVLSVDTEGRIIAGNRAAGKAFGVSVEQLSGMHLQRFLPRLQLAELLRGFTVPRFGLPVTVRGRDFRLDWSPMALGENPGKVESLAGAVLTLQLAPGASSSPELPEPKVLWDFDRRRASCLALQQLAPHHEPLLIVGERGSGKSTFAAAAYYLSPLADTGDILWWPGGEQEELDNLLSSHAPGVLVIDDLHLLSEAAQHALMSALLSGELRLRVIASATGIEQLLPGLQQFFSLQVIQLPALRMMRPAIREFCEAIGAEQGNHLPLADSALQALQSMDWPSNLRGLEDVLLVAQERALSGGASAIEVGHLPLLKPAELLPWAEWGRGLDYRQMMEKAERALLSDFTRDNPSTRVLARRLGLSHTAVANKLRKYGLGGEGKA